jgi:large subunit ribosomal protein L22
MKAKKTDSIISVSRYVRVSSLKIRRILDQIRNRPCKEALLLLKFMPQKSCIILSKLISSAMSNAKNNLSWNESMSFFIAEARVDEGPSLKRFCPHAQGRAFPIKKRMSHIVSLVL